MLKQVSNSNPAFTDMFRSERNLLQARDPPARLIYRR